MGTQLEGGEKKKSSWVSFPASRRDRGSSSGAGSGSGRHGLEPLTELNVLSPPPPLTLPIIINFFIIIIISCSNSIGFFCCLNASSGAGGKHKRWPERGDAGAGHAASPVPGQAGEGRDGAGANVLAAAPPRSSQASFTAALPSPAAAQLTGSQDGAAMFSLTRTRL